MQVFVVQFMTLTFIEIPDCLSQLNRQKEAAFNRFMATCGSYAKYCKTNKLTNKINTNTIIDDLDEGRSQY